MAVKIRLARRGRKRKPIYNLVVADSRSPRDGKFIQNLGIYNPNTNPATVDFDEDAAFEWVMKGAQPTDTARTLLSYKGVMFRKHLQIGVAKGAITQEAADEKFNAWKEAKLAKIEGKIARLAGDADKAAKARFDAEAKKNQDRADAIATRKAEAEAAAQVEEAATDEAEGEAPAAEETEA
ncbi:30S ribosomal protein S16 [Persicobacter psychrovividus]|uniref:Small ribosomal subunit protein bS16 n=1 Tax=Persicobacter psychrovividus TaxID=387638 RepID=A0ABM7VHH7_9BACT|nr:30S ribosomal protein S16 [Persicobacter psychrovividus]